MCANTRMFSLAVPVQRLCILQQNGATDTAPGGPRGADRGPRPKAQGLTLSPRLPVHLPCSEHCHALGPLVLSPRHSLWYRQTATQTLEVACEASSQMRVFLSLSADVTAEPGRVTCPWPPSSSYLPLPERHGSPTWHTLQSRWHSTSQRRPVPCPPRRALPSPLPCPLPSAEHCRRCWPQVRPGYPLPQCLSSTSPCPTSCCSVLFPPLHALPDASAVYSPVCHLPKCGVEVSNRSGKRAGCGEVQRTPQMAHPGSSQLSDMCSLEVPRGQLMAQRFEK